jgi:signal transduction histidine kinase
MPPDKRNHESYPNYIAHLDNVRYAVTKRFCIFCFALALLSVPASFTSHIRSTLIINAIFVGFYAIPLILILKSDRYAWAARAYLAVAIAALLCNQAATNFDASLPTVGWYFALIVFAGLVVNQGWALAIAGIALISVTVSAALHLSGVVPHHSLLLERSLAIGTPIALLTSFIMLLYLLTVYQRLRDRMVRDIVESDTQKSRLVGVLSHDLRNYLGAITGIVSILDLEIKLNRTDELIESLSGNTKVIQEAASQAVVMIDEFVSVARDEVDAGVYMEPHEMTGFIMPIFTRYRILARQKGIEFVVGRDFKQVSARISRDKFSRVMENIFSNALKFSRKGDFVTVSVKTSGSNVIISVADTGIGIPPELKDNIFDPYTKARRHGTAGEKTTGLGMSIVKKIVEQHGGSIWFESEPGNGTTFFIKLATA